jgi:hypothetical protein
MDLHVIFHMLTIQRSARGNTSLESAVTLTKALRWDIQALGVRLDKAANAEELSRRNSTRATTREQHAAELRFIVQDIKKLLVRIEDAVPLINLAITTSGVSLSTTLPATVSPSRLLQASTLLTAGDTQFSMTPQEAVPVGPAFKLSLYMLFAGHKRERGDEPNMRNTTWKEVIHKARVQLIRVPLREAYGLPVHGQGQPPVHESASHIMPSIEEGPHEEMLPGDGGASEFAYQLEIVEDLDDGRVHTFEANEPHPGPYKEVAYAGIREHVPIYEVSKIFYADTGKILNIGNDSDTNSPILLVKRDVNAQPPRRMMESNEQGYEWHGDDVEPSEEEIANIPESDDTDDTQFDIDDQLRRESSVQPREESEIGSLHDHDEAWRLPSNLDPEWMAFEVFTEEEDDSSEDEQDFTKDSGYVSGRPSSSFATAATEDLAGDLESLRLATPSSPTDSTGTSQRRHVESTTYPIYKAARSSPLGPITTSLSLLEMLVRLTALQQFEQASHLSIRDELLSFFLEDSSTTGAGGDGDQRRRTRLEARQKVGFDPYDESPIKRHGEEYQVHGGHPNYERQGSRPYSRSGTPYEDYDSRDDYYRDLYPRNTYSPRTPKLSRSATPQQTLEPWLLRGPTASPSARSPVSPHRAQRKMARPIDRLQAERNGLKSRSPLGRGMNEKEVKTAAVATSGTDEDTNKHSEDEE